MCCQTQTKKIKKENKCAQKSWKVQKAQRLNSRGLNFKGAKFPEEQEKMALEIKPGHKTGRKREATEVI